VEIAIENLGCLPRETLPSEHRSKKLHGSGCTYSKKVLQDILTTIDGALLTFEYTVALFCHKSIHIAKLEKKWLDHNNSPAILSRHDQMLIFIQPVQDISRCSM